MAGAASLGSERPTCTFVGSSEARPARIRLQAYLGHKNIQHTVRYTELSPTRFKNFWWKP